MPKRCCVHLPKIGCSKANNHLSAQELIVAKRLLLNVPRSLEEEESVAL